MKYLKTKHVLGQYYLKIFFSLLMICSAVGPAHRVWAEDDSQSIQFAQIDSFQSPSEPLKFFHTLRPILPKPVVALNKQDAVALELIKRSRTLDENEALHTAQIICNFALELNWDPLLYLAVIHVESDYNHLAISPVGAEGLMQLMPHTAEWMAQKIDVDWSERHSFDPVKNVTIGIKYLYYLSQRFKRLDEVLTAYNRGPKATRFIIKRHGRLPDEVKAFYASKVISHYNKLCDSYRHLS